MLDYERPQAPRAGTTVPYQKGRLLTAADRLERMARALPRWNPHVGERWDVFLIRSYEAEMALAGELRRAPGCELSMCPIREHVELSLAGMAVHTSQGLARACLDWAAEARARYGEPGSKDGS